MAGAGSGKTKVLIYKTVWLIKEKKVNPKNILLTTFTNKATEEMKQRIKKMLTAQNSQSALPYISTFHSFCAYILREKGEYLNIPSSYLIYDKKDQLDLIKQVSKILGLDQNKDKPRAILKAILSAKNSLIGPKEYKNYTYGSFQKTVAKAYSLYQKLLDEYQAVDFGDLIFKTVSLFKKNLKILKSYQNRFQYILV